MCHQIPTVCHECSTCFIGQRKQLLSTYSVFGTTTKETTREASHPEDLLCTSYLPQTLHNRKVIFPDSDYVPGTTRGIILNTYCLLGHFSCPSENGRHLFLAYLLWAKHMQGTPYSNTQRVYSAGHCYVPGTMARLSSNNGGPTMLQVPHKGFKEWEQNHLLPPYLLCAGYHAKWGEGTYYVQGV